LAELRRWLPDLPVSWLAYRADEIEPKMDWYALAAAIEPYFIGAYEHWPKIGPFLGHRSVFSKPQTLPKPAVVAS
jgi:hypothetical protein